MSRRSGVSPLRKTPPWGSTPNPVGEFIEKTPRTPHFLIQRLLQFIAVLLGVTALVFFLLRIAPGDAAYIRLHDRGMDLSKESLAAVREELGLNQPLLTQYFLWLGDLLRFDLGTSLLTGEPVAAQAALHFRWTLQLALPVICLSILCAFPLGLVSALCQKGFWDGFIRVLVILALSIPSFCLGLLGILLFSVRLRWLPSFGAGTPAHLVLPVLTLSAGSIAYYTRFIRAAFLEEFSQEYIRGARARGVKIPGLVRSALKNALIPVITSLGMSIAFLLGGSAVVEKVFSWPGVGKYFIDAVLQRDYPVVQGCVLLFGLIFVSINLGADLLCNVLDPLHKARWGFHPIRHNEE